MFFPPSEKVGECLDFSHSLESWPYFIHHNSNSRSSLSFQLADLSLFIIICFHFHKVENILKKNFISTKVKKILMSSPKKKQKFTRQRNCKLYFFPQNKISSYVCFHFHKFQNISQQKYVLFIGNGKNFSDLHYFHNVKNIRERETINLSFYKFNFISTKWKIFL